MDDDVLTVPLLKVQCVASEGLQISYQRITRLSSFFGVRRCNGMEYTCVQSRTLCHVGPMLMHHPKSPAVDMKRCCCIGCPWIAGCRFNELVRLPVGVKKGVGIHASSGVLDACDALVQSRLLRRPNATRSLLGYQPVQHAARFQQVQIIRRVNLRHAQPASRLDFYHTIGCQALQGFSKRRSADSKLLRKLTFRKGVAGRQLQRHNQLLYAIVSLVGQ